MSTTITYNGKTQTVQEWSAETGIPEGTLYGRINRGNKPADILKKGKRKINTKQHPWNRGI